MDPGEKTINVYLNNYDGLGFSGTPPLLTSYTFTTVPLVQRTLTATVDPATGPHGSTFTFWGIYTSADGVQPQSVTLSLDGQSFPMTRDRSWGDTVQYTVQKVLDYGAHSYNVEARVNASDLSVVLTTPPSP